MPSSVRSRPPAAPPPERAEVKVNVRAKDVARAMKALDLDAGSGQPRTIAFFDTPKRKLQARGLVLRAREKDGEGASTVKLRPLGEAKVPKKLAADPGYKLELELGSVASRRTVSASIDAAADDGTFGDVVAGEDRPKQLFTEAQRTFAEDLAGPIRWKKLRCYGPIEASTWKVAHPKLGSKQADAELWNLPGGARMLELSIKCSLEEVDAVRASLLGLLAGHGVPASKSSGSKTERALAAFAAHDD